MGIPYFPGCTLSTKAKNYDRSGRAVAEALGFPLEELPEWQCCGATFPLMLDDSMALIAPTRILYQAQQAGDRVTTLCSICFNVLRRSQALLGRDEEMLDRINWFTEEEYEGDVHVAHFLEILRDDVGWEGGPESLAERVKRPLTGLKVAPYYGCLLLRPFEEIGLDDPEDPHILHDLVRALGAEPVDFPYNVECCGSYLIVKEPDVPKSLAKDIVVSAREHGADVIITACPLCQFNLDYPQRETKMSRAGEQLPVLYFTQLMAVALGLPEETWGFEDHYVDPRPLLARVANSP
ncbi:MAG: CoB--CoM heterodisulfide reductase iron-sulfur subunit B family protein [Anaerolineae bacterium]|nr:CoB--CoM heterodisulfide reductase iron-sulfur subunit B family protein [Anaerolineae bacterium]